MGKKDWKMSVMKMIGAKLGIESPQDFLTMMQDDDVKSSLKDLFMTLKDSMDEKDMDHDMDHDDMHDDDMHDDDMHMDDTMNNTTHDSMDDNDMQWHGD